MTSNQVFENCQLEESHWKINHMVTTEYIILALNQHSIFIFHYFNVKLLGKYSQTPVWQPCDSCQILDLINFKTTSIWLYLPTLLESVKFLGWNTVKLLTGMLQSLHSLGFCAENFLLIQISFILSVIFTRLWLKCQRVFWWARCTSARHAGSFACLMTSLILITMDNGRGHCACWQSCKVPNQTHRGMKKK